MECNKDEAVRAKEIAEKKFDAKDISGAKKFALKAERLYPGLEGVSQMLTTLDVYIAAENKIYGETDWYRILNVSPQADDETVRKQYRKLALMLHPDKNKSIGAEGAFKLISEAWIFLSDKNKKQAYDQKRNVRASTEGGGFSSASGANGFPFTKTTSPKVRGDKSSAQAGHVSAPLSSQNPKSNTFWTVCHRCKMQYEYLRMYLNHHLLCPNCSQPFLAQETPQPPVQSTYPKTSSFSHQHKNSKSQWAGNSAANIRRNHTSSSHVRSTGHTDPESFKNTTFQWGPFSRTSGAAQAATVVQQAYERVKREREEAQAATKREEALRRKHHKAKRRAENATTAHPKAKIRRGVHEFVPASYRSSRVPLSSGTGGNDVVKSISSEQGNLETSRMDIITNANQTQVMLQSLKDKARIEIHQKLNEWNAASMAKPAATEQGNKKENVEEMSGIIGDLYARCKAGESSEIDNKGHPSMSFPDTSDVHLCAQTLVSMSMTVPDPDFYDFDKDRTEKSFEENQVWAVYDNDDGMPRYYAMIHNVISLSPFKMQIRWLSYKTDSESGTLNWVVSGFSNTCGRFREGKCEINGSLNSFSQKVKWTKDVEGVIQIYPRMGEVWALYRNWSPAWNELTPNEVVHKYEMVEVLEDYTEELGVTIVPLVKVAGFKTVFCRHLNPDEMRRIPKGELFRFSHLVPSHVLTAQEAPYTLKGCLELDPAATPLELLQVIPDGQELKLAEGEQKVEEQDVITGTVEVVDKSKLENSEKLRNGQKGDLMDMPGVETVKDLETETDGTGLNNAEDK